MAYRNSTALTSMGIDTGGTGQQGDNSVITVMTDRHVLKLVVVPPEDIDSLPLYAADLINQHRVGTCVVDATGGYSSSLIYRLDQMGHTVIPLNFAARATRDHLFSNARAELYVNLARWIKRPDVAIPDDRVLIRELAAQTYKHDTKGRLLLEPKDKVRQELGHSPDRADSLALALHGHTLAPQEPAPLFAPTPRNGRDRYQSDYRRPHHLRPDTTFQPHGGREYDPFAS